VKGALTVERHINNMSTKQNDILLESIWEDVEEVHPEWPDEDIARETFKIFDKMGDMAYE